MMTACLDAIDEPAPDAVDPEPPSAAAPQWFELPDLGLIAVDGPDAADFLQGQITSDIRELAADRTHLSSHCSHRGRVLAIFRLLRLDGVIHLLLPRERIPDLLKRLRMFVLRSRVTLADVSDRLHCLGLAGVGAPALLEARGLPVPAAADELAVDPAGPTGLAVLRLPGAAPRFMLLVPDAAPNPPRTWLAAGAPPADPAAWTLLDIQAGLPWVYESTADTFVPQMLNLDLLGAISFRKGCYTGQEVVARLRYLGKLKRRLHVAEVASERAPRPGDELYAPESQSSQASGWVVETAPLGVGRHALLVVAEIAAAASGGVRLGENGPWLRLEPPPQGLDDDSGAAALDEAGSR